MGQRRFYKFHDLKWNAFLNFFCFSILLIFEFKCQSFFNTKGSLPENFFKLILLDYLFELIEKSPFTFSKLFLKHKFAGYKYLTHYDNSKERILMIEHLAMLGHKLI